MDLIFQNKNIEINSNPTVEKVMNTINDLLEDNYYYSHLIVDGIEVYDDAEIYLSEHISQINKLEIIIKTVNEFVYDILLTAKQYIDNAKPEISALSDEFYQNPTKDSWKKFSQMLEGTQWLNHVILTIDQSKFQPKNWIEYIKNATKLQQELMNLEEGIEQNDSILIADILKYEIFPIYDSFDREIQSTFDIEGYHHDFS